MKPTEALQVIEQALNAATLKGVYSLVDANTIVQALSVIQNLEEIKESLSEEIK